MNEKQTISDKPGQGEGGESLTASQEKALSALLTSGTVEAAAAKAGLTDRTLHRYLSAPAFRRAYLLARRQALEQATGALQQASYAAVATLIKNLKCGSPSSEIRAAQVILEQSAKGVEMLEFEDRLTAIEQSLEATGGQAGREGQGQYGQKG